MVDCRRFLTYYRFQRPNLYDTDVGRSVAMCRRDSRGKGVVCSRGTMKLRMRVKNVGLCINTSLAVQVTTKLLPCTPEKGLKHTVTMSSFHINWLSRHTVARRNKLTGDRGLRGEAKIKSWPYEIVDYVEFCHIASWSSGRSDARTLWSAQRKCPGIIVTSRLHEHK